MTNSLRKGDKNPQVKTLQDALNRVGFRLNSDGHFGSRTDLAVRAFQRKVGLLPDGIAGAKTQNALNIGDSRPNGAIVSGPKQDFLRDVVKRIGPFIAGPAKVAQVRPAALMPSADPYGMHISQNGLRFIYSHEAYKGVSNHLHWPKGASGVTLGPGYDMKERRPDQIASDMEAIGLDSVTAKKIAGGSALTGSAASQFAKDNKQLVDLTPSQETQLLKFIVPAYELTVRQAIHIPLLQNEFDALVSFAYNPGGRLRTMANLLNQRKVADAMTTIKQANTSGGAVMQGLVNRRSDEVTLYLYGNYGR